MATRKTKNGVVCPVLHLNGSGHQNLVSAYMAAYNAVEVALRALGEAGPHGRDYYVCGGGAHEEAQRQHEAMYMKLREVTNTIGEIVTDIENQQNERNAMRAANSPREEEKKPDCKCGKTAFEHGSQFLDHNYDPKDA